MNLSVHRGGFDTFMAFDPQASQLAFAWLGQAGFAFRYEGALILVDPYLSDSLAAKYKDAEFPHIRMMPIPVEPGSLQACDVVLCTHRHTDHMDPGTIPSIAEASPACQFVVPLAEFSHALSIGLPPDRTRGVNARDSVTLENDIRLDCIPSAHEELQMDERGNHRFLGYVLRFGDITVYHSGDCVPYDKLTDELKRLGPQVAFLPVNGRDPYRRERGVPGNMQFEEAADICYCAGIEVLVPHHFGMFDFNTLDTGALCDKAEGLPTPPDCQVPSSDEFYVFPG